MSGHRVPTMPHSTCQHASSSSGCMATCEGGGYAKATARQNDLFFSQFKCFHDVLVSILVILRKP
jgi:hypothetical protein